MAKFLIQNNKGVLENEEHIILELLKSQRLLHEYKSISFEDIKSINNKGLYPIGTIDFVTAYLRNAYGIKRENPIEIPKYLRTDEFLKRDYFFTSWDKLPKHGTYFLKDVSELKNFGQVIQADYFINDDLFNYTRQLVLPKDHVYLVSSLFNIKSEYRVYVLQHEIEAIVCYDGDCTIFPDVNLIKKAVSLIRNNEEWLRSYTIDIMVGVEGTAIIEIHNFTSIGLYSTIWGSSLIWAYKDGIDYIVNDNKLLEK